MLERIPSRNPSKRVLDTLRGHTGQRLRHARRKIDHGVYSDAEARSGQYTRLTAFIDIVLISGLEDVRDIRSLTNLLARPVAQD